MSKLFPTQEIGSLKKPADMLKKVKDPNVSDEEKIKIRNDAAILNTYARNLRLIKYLFFEKLQEVRKMAKLFPTQ